MEGCRINTRFFPVVLFSKTIEGGGILVCCTAGEVSTELGEVPSSS